MVAIIIAALCRLQGDGGKEPALEERIKLIERRIREEFPGSGGDPHLKDIWACEAMAELRNLYPKATVSFVLERVSMEDLSWHTAVIPMEAARALLDRLSPEVCEAILKSAEKSWNKNKLWAPEMVRVVGKAKDPAVIPVVRAALDRAGDPYYKAVVCRELGSLGDRESIPRMLMVYDTLKETDLGFLITEAFARIGDSTCLPALKDHLLRKAAKGFEFQKEPTIRALFRLRFVDAETSRGVLDLAGTCSSEATRYTALLQQSARYLGLVSTEPAKDFLGRYARRARDGRPWKDLSEDEIHMGLACVYGMASQGDLNALISLLRYTGVERKVTREWRNEFGDRSDEEIEIGPEIKEQALPLLSELTGERFSTVEELGRWFQDNLRRLKWDSAQKAFRPR